MRLTDKEWRQHKARIDKLIKKWVRPIGLGWWAIDFEFKDEDKENDECIGKCLVRWPYKQATITFNLNNVSELDDGKLEYAFIHELMHIFVNEMRFDEDDFDHEERVCTDLARSFLFACKFVEPVKREH